MSAQALLKADKVLLLHLPPLGVQSLGLIAYCLLWSNSLPQ